MDRIAVLLSTTNTILVMLLVFKDMSGSSELRKIREQLENQLRVCGKKHNKFVHRLVGDAFLEKPDGVVEINHKDGNKKNNHASNLEWCTSSQNHSHRCHVLGEKPTNLNIMHQKNSKRVVCIETGDVFKSITDAAKSVGVGLPTMSAHLHGNTENCAGLHWKFDRRAGDGK